MTKDERLENFGFLKRCSAALARQMAREKKIFDSAFTSREGFVSSICSFYRLFFVVLYRFFICLLNAGFKFLRG